MYTSRHSYQPWGKLTLGSSWNRGPSFSTVTSTITAEETPAICGEGWGRLGIRVIFKESVFVCAKPQRERKCSFLQSVLFEEGIIYTVILFARKLNLQLWLCCSPRFTSWGTRYGTHLGLATCAVLDETAGHGGADSEALEEASYSVTEAQRHKLLSPWQRKDGGEMNQLISKWMLTWMESVWVQYP